MCQCALRRFGHWTLSWVSVMQDKQHIDPGCGCLRAFTKCVLYKFLNERLTRHAANNSWSWMFLRSGSVRAPHSCEYVTHKTPALLIVWILLRPRIVRASYLWKWTTRKTLCAHVAHLLFGGNRFSPGSGAKAVLHILLCQYTLCIYCRNTVQSIFNRRVDSRHPLSTVHFEFICARNGPIRTRLRKYSSHTLKGEEEACSRMNFWQQDILEMSFSTLRFEHVCGRVCKEWERGHHDDSRSFHGIIHASWDALFSSLIRAHLQLWLQWVRDKRARWLKKFPLHNSRDMHHLTVHSEDSCAPPKTSQHALINLTRQKPNTTHRTIVRFENVCRHVAIWSFSVSRCNCVIEVQALFVLFCSEVKRHQRELALQSATWSAQTISVNCRPACRTLCLPCQKSEIHFSCKLALQTRVLVREHTRHCA